MLTEEDDAARFEDDPHLKASVLHRELVDAGSGRAYTTLVGELRRSAVAAGVPGLRAPPRRPGHDRDRSPWRCEIQWGWLELAAADTPWGEPAYVLLGALSHAGRFQALFCEAMTFGHLASAMHQVLDALGGTPHVWRTDRMATIVTLRTGRITPDVAAPAKHYGTQIAVCPARRAQRKGVVEAAIKYLTHGWWRTAAVATLGEAQRDLDACNVRVTDQRKRSRGTVGEIGGVAGSSLSLPLRENLYTPSVAAREIWLARCKSASVPPAGTKRHRRFRVSSSANGLRADSQLIASRSTSQAEHATWRLRVARSGSLGRRARNARGSGMVGARLRPATAVPSHDDGTYLSFDHAHVVVLW